MFRYRVTRCFPVRILPTMLLFLGLMKAPPSLGHAPKGLASKALSKQMREFIAKLNAKQKKELEPSVNSEKRKEWHYVPMSRDGISLKSMTPSQRDYALNVLKSYLSEQGFVTAKIIMDLESILKKEGSFFIRRDPLGYYVEIFGTPDPKAAWGFSFEGHHLSLNYVIQNDRIVSFSPLFFGANPAEVKKAYGVGPAKGTRPLAALETLAFKLLTSLSPVQRSAVIRSNEALDDVRSGGDPTAPAFERKGFPIAGLTKTQLGVFRNLLDAYLILLPGEVGKEFRSLSGDPFLRNTYFSWYGAQIPGVGHYYRIDHPKFLIELANTQSDVSGNPANHVHALWRTRP